MEEVFFEISTNDINVKKTLTVIAEEIAQRNGLVLALKNGRIVAAVKEELVNVCVLRRLSKRKERISDILTKPVPLEWSNRE